MCGVKTDAGPCLRGITCKMHAVALKRAVLGRSSTFDILLAEYQAKAHSKKGTYFSIYLTVISSYHFNVAGAAPSVETPEIAPSEYEIKTLLDVIKGNTPHSLLGLNSQFSFSSLMQKCKKQIIHDIFSKL